MGQIVSVNFGLVHTPPSFDYEFDFDDLDDEIKDQLPEDTAEVLESFSEEDLHFLHSSLLIAGGAREFAPPSASDPKGVRVRTFFGTE